MISSSTLIRFHPQLQSFASGSHCWTNTRNHKLGMVLGSAMPHTTVSNGEEIYSRTVSSSGPSMHYSRLKYISLTILALSGSCYANDSDLDTSECSFLACWTPPTRLASAAIGKAHEGRRSSTLVSAKSSNLSSYHQGRRSLSCAFHILTQ